MAGPTDTSVYLRDSTFPDFGDREIRTRCTRDVRVPSQLANVPLRERGRLGPVTWTVRRLSCSYWRGDVRRAEGEARPGIEAGGDTVPAVYACLIWMLKSRSGADSIPGRARGKN